MEQDSGRGEQVPPAVERLGEGLRAGSVEHDADGALLVVVDHEHHAAVEVGVHQGRGGDEESSCRPGRGHAKSLSGGHAGVMLDEYA